MWGWGGGGGEGGGGRCFPDVYNRVINNWNNLPCNIVTAGTLNTFKNVIGIITFVAYISKLESKRRLLHNVITNIIIFKLITNLINSRQATSRT